MISNSNDLYFTMLYPYVNFEWNWDMPSKTPKIDDAYTLCVSNASHAGNTKMVKYSKLVLAINDKCK